jgi:prepilin-type N-terminal cleavage/methylation domain-containing protein
MISNPLAAAQQCQDVGPDLASAPRTTEGPNSHAGCAPLDTRALSSPPSSASRAFTLVEVLVALALLAALLAAINHFVFSIAEAWTKDQDRFVFAQHARAVTRHLDELLRTSSAAARASASADGAPGAAEMRVPDGGQQMLVTFDLPKGDRVLAWDERPLPEVQCALALRRDEGLVLYYKSRLEDDFEDAVPRTAVLSPFVTHLSFDYFDQQFNAWRTEEVLRVQEGVAVAPRRIRIRFERGNQHYTEIVTLPAPVEGVPGY